MDLAHSRSTPRLELLTADIVRANSVDSENIHFDESPTSSDGSSGRKQISSRPNRDPMSHRIIEKRRRDRMNNCLTNLSKLIPSAYLKKGRGRIEKTEIIEMAIRYMRHMQEERKRLNPALGVVVHELMKDKAVGTDLLHASSTSVLDKMQVPSELISERYRQGFFDCIAETLRFLVVAEGLPINQATKTRMLLHLKDYFSRITYDNLGPGFADLWHAASTCATSVNYHNHGVRFPLAVGNEISTFADSASPSKDDQPLNMSIKRPRTEKSSQLRDILTVGKDSPIYNASPASPTHPLPKRPLVLRYGANFSGHSGPGGHIQYTPGVGSSLLMASVDQAMYANSGGTPNSTGAYSGSTQYPSSPGSSHSFSGASTGSYAAADSPPRVLSPPPAAGVPAAHQHYPQTHSAGLPIFALHPSGLYYVAMSLSPGQVDPALLHNLSVNYPHTPGPGTCHPVTITVNFCHANSMDPAQVCVAANDTMESRPGELQSARHLARDGVILAAASSTNGVETGKSNH